MQSGVTIAPPPTPAIVVSIFRPIRTKIPPISNGSSGNTFLWMHVFVSFKSHMLKTTPYALLP